VKCLYQVSTVSGNGGIPRWSACTKSVQWVVTEVYQCEVPVSSQYSEWLRRYTKVKCLYQVSTVSGNVGIPRWSACTKSVQWVVTEVYQGEVPVSSQYCEWLRGYTKVKSLYQVSTVSSYGGIPRWSACIKSVQWVVTEVYQGEVPVPSQYCKWLRRYTKVKCLYQVRTVSGYGDIPRWSACIKSVQWVDTEIYQGEVPVSSQYSEWLRRYTKVKCLYQVRTVSGYGGIPRWNAWTKSVQWVVTEVYQGEVYVSSQ
jgi:hypothetical protein